jgi:hypothetical protein
MDRAVLVRPQATKRMSAGMESLYPTEFLQRRASDSMLALIDEWPTKHSELMVRTAVLREQRRTGTIGTMGPGCTVLEALAGEEG